MRMSDFTTSNYITVNVVGGNGVVYDVGSDPARTQRNSSASFLGTYGALLSIPVLPEVAYDLGGTWTRDTNIQALGSLQAAVGYNFRQFRVRSLKIHYIPRAGTFREGNVTVAYDPDVVYDATNVTTTGQVAAMERFSLSCPYSDATAVYQQKQFEIPVSGRWRYGLGYSNASNANSQNEQSEWRQIADGAVYIYVTVNNTGSDVGDVSYDIGEIFVEADMEYRHAAIRWSASNVTAKKEEKAKESTSTDDSGPAAKSSSTVSASSSINNTTTDEQWVKIPSSLLQGGTATANPPNLAKRG
jgi:hypothetical protein